MISTDIEPSAIARNFAARWDKDPRAVELVLRQTSRIVRMDNARADRRNRPRMGVRQRRYRRVQQSRRQPRDSTARGCRRLGRRMRAELKRLSGAEVAVLITDTFGRPWRDGLTEVCIGIAGIDPMLDLRGTTDLGGRELHHTVIAIADEIAAAAGLMMPKAGATPAVLVRGYQYHPAADASAKALIRPAASDLFR